MHIASLKNFPESTSALFRKSWTLVSSVPQPCGKHNPRFNSSSRTISSLSFIDVTCPVELPVNTLESASSKNNIHRIAESNTLLTVCIFSDYVFVPHKYKTIIHIVVVLSYLLSSWPSMEFPYRRTKIYMNQGQLYI
jgi:hypothetical protein